MADAIFEPEVKRSLSWLQSMYPKKVFPVAIECKKTQEPRLSFDRVQEHQVEGLIDFEDDGYVLKMIVSQGFGGQRRFTGTTPFDFLIVEKGKGFLLVNFRFTKKQPRKDIPKGTNRCFAVPISQYAKERYKAKRAKVASLNYDWFVENAIECDRIRIPDVNGKYHGGWDLLPLLGVFETSAELDK